MLRLTRIPLLAGLALSSLALTGPAVAHTSRGTTVQLDGVRTTLAIAPATTKVLVSHGILPLPVAPATVTPTFSTAGLSLVYSFPITGGSLDATTLAGYINHSGGLRFVNLLNGHSLTLTRFQIHTADNPGLSAEVNGDPHVRVRILNLDLSGATIDKDPPRVTVSGVRATLTSQAAAALNQALGVSFFTRGIALGTAQVDAHIA